VRDTQAPELAGRKLAISFHVAGESGPMTWHAKALTTSFVTAPNAGAKGAGRRKAAFPYPTASWFFLDAVDMMMPPDTGWLSHSGTPSPTAQPAPLNGGHRWPDVLARGCTARSATRSRSSMPASAAIRLPVRLSIRPQSRFAVLEKIMMPSSQITAEDARQRQHVAARSSGLRRGAANGFAAEYSTGPAT